MITLTMGEYLNRERWINKYSAKELTNEKADSMPAFLVYNESNCIHQTEGNVINRLLDYQSLKLYIELNPMSSKIVEDSKRQWVIPLRTLFYIILNYGFMTEKEIQ